MIDYDFDNELPKREDDIYREIEAFADYELTQCIAYEMAFRNPENIESIDSIIDYYCEHKTEIDNTILKRPDGQATIRDFHSYPFHQLYLKVARIDFLSERYEEERFSPLFLEVLDKLDYLIKENQEIEQAKVYEDNGYIEATTTSKGIGYKIETNFIESIPLETNFDESIPHDPSIVKKYTFDDVKSIILLNRQDDREIRPPETKRKVIEMFKRPKLKLYPLDTNETILEVNLNRPLGELLSLIKHIKEDIEENDLLKAPIELLGEDLDKSDTKISKKKLADKFFVYDYVTARLKQINKDNQDAKDIFEIEKEDINSNNSLDADHKKYLIKEAEKEMKECLVSTNPTYIFLEEELKSQIASGTASKYYYRIMKPYIHDMKYKELITGVHTEKTS